MFHIQNIFRGYCWVPSVGVYCSWVTCPSGFLHFLSSSPYTCAEGSQGTGASGTRWMFWLLSQVSTSSLKAKKSHVVHEEVLLLLLETHFKCYLKHVLFPKLVRTSTLSQSVFGAVNPCGFTLKQKSCFIFLIAQLLFHFWASSDFSYLSIKRIMTGSSCHQDTLYG